MSTPQNTIAIVYDYDQTLSPSYMQDEVVFPTFGIDGTSFWRRCSEFVSEQGYHSKLAYMKVLLDTLGMRKNDGRAIAVHNPDDPERVGFKKCYQFFTRSDRVRHIAPADFRRDSHLRALLEQTVDEIASRIVEQRRAAIEPGTVRTPRH